MGTAKCYDGQYRRGRWGNERVGAKQGEFLRAGRQWEAMKSLATRVARMTVMDRGWFPRRDGQVGLAFRP